MRPAIAIAVSSATAVAALPRPITGSRNAIRWTMKPTCANSTSANEMDTLRNATSRKASARTFDADGASVRTCPAAMSRRMGGRPTKIRMTGIVSTSIAAAAIIIAPGNPKRPIAATSNGTPTMPPKLAPFSARLIAMPRF